MMLVLVRPVGIEVVVVPQWVESTVRVVKMVHLDRGNLEVEEVVGNC